MNTPATMMGCGTLLVLVALLPLAYIATKLEGSVGISLSPRVESLNLGRLYKGVKRETLFKERFLNSVMRQ